MEQDPKASACQNGWREAEQARQTERPNTEIRTKLGFEKRACQTGGEAFDHEHRHDSWSVVEMRQSRRALETKLLPFRSRKKLVRLDSIDANRSSTNFLTF